MDDQAKFNLVIVSKTKQIKPKPRLKGKNSSECYRVPTEPIKHQIWLQAKYYTTYTLQSKTRNQNEDMFPNAPHSSKASYGHSETCSKVKLKNFIRSQHNAKLQVFCLLNYAGKSNPSDLLKEHLDFHLKNKCEKGDDRCMYLNHIPGFQNHTCKLR